MEVYIAIDFMSKKYHCNNKLAHTIKKTHTNKPTIKCPFLSILKIKIPDTRSKNNLTVIKLSDLQ